MKRFVLIASLLLAVLWIDAAHAAEAVDCGRLRVPHVVVSSSAHELTLCVDGRPTRTFDVRVSSGGTGKSREGDKKLPLGWYDLGRPRASRAYGLFIPIGYPTPEQRRRGMTGGGVGIHGPDRRVRWLGRANNWFDTTDGCVGLATDEDMEAVAGLVRSSRAKRIIIE